MRQITDRTLFNVSKRRQSAKCPTVLKCQWRILVSELRNEEPRQGNKHDGVFQPQGRLQNWSHIADALVRCLRDWVLDTLLELRRIPDNIHCPGDDRWSGVLLLQPRAVAAVPDGQGLHHQHLQLQQHGRTGSGLVTVFPYPPPSLSLSLSLPSEVTVCGSLDVQIPKPANSVCVYVCVCVRVYLGGGGRGVQTERETDIDTKNPT